MREPGGNHKSELRPLLLINGYLARELMLEAADKKNDKAWRMIFTCTMPRQVRRSSSTIVRAKSGHGYLITQYAGDEAQLAAVTDGFARMIAKSPP